MEIYFEDYPDEILEFLYDHPQAWEDCCNHFGVDPADENALDEIDIMDWIYDHDQLCDDLYSYLEKVAINKQASMSDYYKDHLADISLSEALKIAFHEGNVTPGKYKSDFTNAIESKYINTSTSTSSKILNESTRLTESSKRVAQISFDIMYDPESDEPNSQPDDIAYGFEWELDNTGYCKVLGSNIEDITDVYKDQYSNDFPELAESLTEGVVTDRVKRFIDTVEKFQDDMTFTDNKNGHDLELTNKEIEMLDSLRSSLSRYSNLEESLNESSMPPIRKVLQDNKIMDTLDKDPQGTINKALQVVRDSDEISAKDKNTFTNAVGKGPLSKKVSSLASYFYDVNRVGRRR